MKNLKTKAFKSTKGITLIALVVTIIILLILAGVSIAMLTGNNGVLTKAGEAKVRTGDAGDLEKIQLEVAGSFDESGKINLAKLKSNFDENGISYNDVDSFPITATLNRVKRIVNQNGEMTEPVDRTGIQVGDYIDYSPDVAETVTYSNSNMTKYSGYTGTDYNVDLKRDTTMKWQVLRINEDGSMDIIGTPTSYSVYFSNAKGYNNGVYLMNDICKTLYSNGAHNITARSVNQDDMEKWLTDDVKDASGNVTTKGGKTAKSESIKSYISSLTGGTSYIESVDTANNTVKYKKDRSYYPILAGYENGIGIDTDVKTDGIGLSEENVKVNNTPLIPTEQTYTQATNNLAVKPTYYSISINSTNYGAGAKALSNSTWYWVASRYVTCYSYSADFGLCNVNTITRGDGMFNSGRSYGSVGRRLRPVVTFRSDVLITPSSTASDENGTAHHINW